MSVLKKVASQHREQRRSEKLEVPEIFVDVKVQTAFTFGGMMLGFRKVISAFTLALLLLQLSGVVTLPQLAVVASSVLFGASLRR